MRRRLALAILAVAALAVVLFGVPLAVVAQRFVDEQGTLRLERRAVLASRQVPGDFATSGDPVELPAGGSATYALYDRRGGLVAGAGPTDGGVLVDGALANEVVEAEHGENRVVAIPIVDQEHVVGVLRASEPTAVADSRANRAIIFLVGLGIAVLGIGALVARVVAGRLARPIVEIRDQAVRLGEGDFDIEVARSGVAELDEAGAALEVTARRLDDLVRRERAFSADASHQLRTPLAALRTSLETELEFPRDEPSLVLTDMLEDVGRLQVTIDQLLSLARDSTFDLTTTRLDHLLESARNDWNGRFAQQDRPLTLASSAGPTEVTGADGLVRQALDVLLDNALVHGAGPVRIGMRTTSESATVSVTDGGSGFGPEPDPVPVGAAHGFGLLLARRLVESCGGRLIVAEPGPSPTVELVFRRPVPPLPPDPPPQR